MGAAMTERARRVVASILKEGESEKTMLGGNEEPEGEGSSGLWEGRKKANVSRVLITVRSSARAGAED